MARPLKVKINETVSELEKRLSRLITVRGRELIQMIYWLKTNQVLTPPELLAKLLGRYESMDYTQAHTCSSWRAKKAVKRNEIKSPFTQILIIRMYHNTETLFEDGDVFNYKL